MTFKKFKNTDIFHNTLEMNPSYDFVVYDGNIYLNNATGSIDLYDGLSGSYPIHAKVSSDKISFSGVNGFSCFRIPNHTSNDWLKLVPTHRQQA